MELGTYRKPISDDMVTKGGQGVEGGEWGAMGRTAHTTSPNQRFVSAYFHFAFFFLESLANS